MTVSHLFSTRYLGWPRLYLLIGLLCLTLQAQAHDLSVHYTLNLDLTQALSQRKISVQSHILIHNVSPSELNELWLVVYPNRFNTTLPNLDDLNFRLMYPGAPSLGGFHDMTLEQGGQRLPWQWLQKQPPGWAPNTLARVALATPIESGATQTLVLTGTLQIPEKFGSFGSYGHQLFLIGSWLPYIASYQQGQFQPQAYPPLADWEIKADSPWPVALADQILTPEQLRQGQSIAQRRMIALVTQPSFRQLQFGDKLKVHLALPKKERRQVERAFDRAIHTWLNYVELHQQYFHRDRDLQLIQVPTRDSLMKAGDGVSFVSDRAFKVIKALHKYHTIPLVQSLFYQLLLPAISYREDDSNYHWIAEAVSWYWTDRFLAYQDITNRDARKIGAISFFSFFPSIDQLIHSPQFAFADTFYDNIYPFDPVRDDPLKFVNRLSHGRTIYERMKDFLGSETLTNIMQSYTQNPSRDFVTTAQALTEHDISQAFQRWVEPQPPVNYRLRKVKQKRTDPGYRYHVEVQRESDQPVREPVELGVTTRDQQSLLLKWFDDQPSHTFTFDTQNKAKVIMIDPRRRLLETRLGDNRRPPQYKFVLTEAILNYDFNNQQPEISLSSQFRKLYASANRYSLSASYFGESYGVGAGYTRLFGRMIDGLRLSHGLGFGYRFSRVRDDYAVGIDRNQNIGMWTQVGDASNLATVAATYFFGSQLSLTNPLEGGGASFSLAWGMPYAGGQHHFIRASTGGSWIIPLLYPDHLLVVRGVFSTSWPSDMPSQVQSRLGGIFGMRGVSFFDNRFRGRHLLLTSAEYRHFLFKDIDINCWLFRVRDIQGALFTDAGRVTNTVQERANRQAFGPSMSQTSLRDVFDPRHFQTDVGYGIRFHLHYLGVNPSLVRFDVAQSLNEFEQGLRLYFGVTQSF